MANDVAVYENAELYGSAQAKREKTKSGYKLTAPGGCGSVMLKRGVDFGEVNGRDCLWKGGAEKIALAYGMLQHYTVELAEERFDIETDPDNRKPFFFYRVRCDLVKVATDGREYVFSTGRGSSNSLEKSNVKQNPFETANKVLKIASKRALASACVALAGASDLFTVDLDDDAEYVKGKKESEQMSDDAQITPSQINAIFDTAEKAGYSIKETKAVLRENGYSGWKGVKGKEFEAICALFKQKD